MPPEAEEISGETPPTFNFNGFFIDRISFKHVARTKPGENEKRPPKIGQTLGINGALFVDHDQRKAKIELTVTDTPDPKWQPYVIELTVVGYFSHNGGTPEQFDQFCRMGVPPILFPYVREAIHHVTRDGRFGVVKLDPINIQNMFEWVSTESTVSAIPSEPSPPSEQ